MMTVNLAPRKKAPLNGYRNLFCVCLRVCVCVCADDFVVVRLCGPPRAIAGTLHDDSAEAAASGHPKTLAKVAVTLVITFTTRPDQTGPAAEAQLLTPFLVVCVWPPAATLSDTTVYRRPVLFTAYTFLKLAVSVKFLVRPKERLSNLGQARRSGYIIISHLNDDGYCYIHIQLPLLSLQYVFVFPFDFFKMQWNSR